MNGTPRSVIGRAGRFQADGACPIGAGTWSAVRSSVDTALSAAGAVLDDLDSAERSPFAYALCRPPGHHAEKTTAMGFCLFGNIAIAAKNALDHHGLGRVAIVDFDVHHGNGTQNLVEDDARVLFVSSH